MGKKLYDVTVKGKEHNYVFQVYLDQKHIEGYREDGIEIDEIVNTIPVWVADFGLTRPWCFFQDIFNFKNPFEK